MNKQTRRFLWGIIQLATAFALLSLMLPELRHSGFSELSNSDKFAWIIYAILFFKGLVEIDKSLK